MRPIPSCPHYFACQNGHIWRDGAQLSERSNGKGYLQVTVSIEGRTFDRYVHRLVCEAYHGPCPPGLQCRHGDGKRNNNIPSNVSWATKAVNEADKIAHGTLNAGERNGQAQLTEAIVIEARRRVAAGEQIKQIAAEFGVHRGTMRDAVRGKKWRHLPGAVHSFRSTAKRY
ncbi:MULTISPECIES: HNH endonuclease [unclassified Bradyrhizobium]|uniref:HNH endonuclease n=1 Tax=unclassified Bradyrhizobium TaxID=2631580 RepID=UPI00291647C7|nr:MULTISPECIES: HNH endonuclease [unclassified Bradyrhizobium]